MTGTEFMRAHREKLRRTRIIVLSRRIGRYALMLTVENVDNQYGRVGSVGRTYHLTVYRDPK